MKKDTFSINIKWLSLLTLLFLPGVSSYAGQQIIKFPHEISYDLTKTKIKNVLIVMAMEREAEPIIKILNLHKTTVNSFSKLPMKAYNGIYNNLKVTLILNGIDPMYGVQSVGTQAATLTTYLGVEYFHPDLIISAGTAGGMKKNNAYIGDIYVSSKIYFYDRRIPLKDYDEYGLGGYKSAVLGPIANKANLKTGIVCSGDSFDNNATDYKIFTERNCIIRDMEAAGVGWVSMLTSIPMIAIKGVTDYLGEEDIHNQFEDNFHSVTKKLANTIKKVLTLLG